jgi:phage shock protein C
MNEVRRLVRARDDRMLAGVCAGIARYFTLDPTLVRVLWVLMVCLGGSGLLAYLICWIVIPEE